MYLTCRLAAPKTPKKKKKKHITLLYQHNATNKGIKQRVNTHLIYIF